MADLDHLELVRMHEKAYTHNQTTRMRAADDNVFHWVTQWDSQLLDDSQLAYKGEFNILRKAYRQIMADLRSNPIQVDFEPVDDSREDGAELLDGLYLTEDRANTTLEAYHNASSESVVCGLGGWELYTEYETNRVGDRNQVIRRRPIYEMNDNAFPDPNAKLLDKSDAKYWSILVPYSVEGYKELYEELTGKETDCTPSNFAFPEQSYTFPWISGDEDLVYIVRFYHKTKIKDKVLTLVDPLGQPIKLLESNLTEIMDELIEQGYEILEEETKEITRWQIKRYIASGEDILKVEEVPGECIPVVPVYGERAFVEGEEHYEGVTRLAKDPSRLRNFVMSYLADIASRSPREKPIFTPEQIAGYTQMYDINGADNNYPYLLQNAKGASGETLPMGPVGTLPAPNIPPSLGPLVDLTRQAVEDVANPGLPQDIADIDISGKAVMALQARLDQQSLVHQENLKHAKRYDAEVFASMASVVFDAPRKVTITMPDGQRKQVEIMETIMDEETGELVTLRDLTNMEFDVYADIGMNYTSKKEQTMDRLGNMAASFAQSDPQMQRALMLKQISMMDGMDMEDIKDYSRRQLMLGGFSEPQTDKDKAWLEQVQNQPKEPDANMVLAKAEELKGQAALLREQREAERDKQEDLNDDARVQIDAFKAETDRAKVQIDAKKAGADIVLLDAKAKGQLLDNVIKVTQPLRARVNG